MEHMKLVDTGTGTGTSAGIGGAIGAVLGNWLGGGLGYGGRGGVGYGALEGATLANAHETSDKLNALGVQLGSLGTDIVQGQGQANLTACQGFNGVNTAILTSSNMLQNSTNQGFAGLNTAITNGIYENTVAIKDLALQNAECCCRTNRTIETEAAATRQLIQQNFITDLQTKLCDEKAKNGALESKLFVSESQAAQTAQIIHAVTNNVVAQLGK